jgi:aspartyl-tRNA(Asn)/glutamyl-tRNA(Gln) amidotransferase subunit C
MISRDEVTHLAGLARIALNADEIDHLATQLDVILGAVAKVQEVAGANVAPTSHPLPLVNVFRPDVNRPSLSNSEALDSAPASEEERFRVPQILGEE